MKKKKPRWNLGLQILPGMNKILVNHAEWLDYNVSKLAGDKCRETAKNYTQQNDPRQTDIRRKK